MRSALAVAAPAVAQDGLNDYPTEARADYVFACMATNGQTRDMLGRCSCSIDMIATILPYDGYVAAETVLRMRLAPGRTLGDVPGCPGDDGDRRRPAAGAGRGGDALLLIQSPVESFGRWKGQPEPALATHASRRFVGRSARARRPRASGIAVGL